MLEPPRQFYDLLGSQAGVWLWSIDPSTGRLDIYSDLTRLLGAHPTDLASLLGFVHPDDQEQVKTLLARSIEEGRPGQLECRFRALDATWITFHVSYCAARHPCGRFALHGVSCDVTSLAQARDAAAEALRQAHFAEQLSGTGHWRYDLVRERFTWSEQVYLIYGLDPLAGEPSFASLIDFCHPEDRERVLSHQETYRRKDAPSLEARIVRPDGEVRHIITRNALERDAQGKPIARFGILQDITDIKRAEAAANKESEQRYRFITEHASDMIVRVSPQGELRFVSPGAKRVFGYEPEELVAMSAPEMTHPDDRPKVAAYMAKMVDRRSPHPGEPLRYRARHKNGSWIWIESNPSVIFDPLTGEPIESIDIIRDISQAKAAEEVLEEARRSAEAAAAAKSTFLANMSHELRTPLTSITGFSRLLEDRTDLPEEARRHARRIRDASEALLAVISDVLDFSKLKTGQAELEARPLSVGRLVEEAAGLLTVQAAAKGISLDLKVDPAMPALVLGDAARLRQVLLNLLSNAVKFTPKGSVKVAASYNAPAQRLRIVVSDTGPGITTGAVALLFERFTQAEVSINRTHGGAGMGLASSKGIVNLMGGTIGVETKEGRGSSFWFEVPAPVAQAATPHSAPDVVELDGPSLSLLIVDDTAVNRELVRLMLEPLGCRIEEAGGGAEGVQAAMRKRFDLILMDVRMPGVDGLEATRAIRGTSLVNRATPILALTADVHPENAAACRAAGMDDVLAKPISPRQLVSKISQWGRVEAGARDVERAS